LGAETLRNEGLMGSEELHFLDLCEVGRRIQKKRLSSVEVNKALIKRIERLDGALKSYSTCTFGLALSQVVGVSRSQAVVLSQRDRRARGSSRCLPRVMTYRSGSVERTAGVPPLPAEVVALPKILHLLPHRGRGHGERSVA
jgi:hypothetical protein